MILSFISFICSNKSNLGCRSFEKKTYFKPQGQMTIWLTRSNMNSQQIKLGTSVIPHFRVNCTGFCLFKVILKVKRSISVQVRENILTNKAKNVCNTFFFMGFRLTNSNHDIILVIHGHLQGYYNITTDLKCILTHYITYWRVIIIASVTCSCITYSRVIHIASVTCRPVT